MADNYLEKRMEELRSGKLGQTFKSASTVYQRSGMNFSFPPKRVLIVTQHPSKESIIQLFLKTGSKVAVMQKDNTHFTGTRNYGVDNIEQNLRDLLKAWRDIDILLVDRENSDIIIKIWRDHRRVYPYVSDYKCRIITLGNKLFQPSGIEQINESLKSTLNNIIPTDNTKDISGLIGMLVLPANDFLNGMNFKA